MTTTLYFRFAIPVWCALILSVPGALAGETQPALLQRKCDARLQLELARSGATGKPAESPLGGYEDIVHVFVYGNGPAVKEEILKRGGSVGTVLDFLVTARIPRRMIPDLAQLPVVERIASSVPLEPDNDSAAVHIGVDKARRGDAPLAGGLTGEGVIVGIIDSGIDFTHPEFRDPQDSTKSRILAVWSQVQIEGTPPEGFGYGVEYTREQIEDEIDGTPAGVVLQNDERLGHGTHVAATAAGNGGMAPGASIIVVQLDFERPDLATTLIDAASYIYAKAEKYGMPCVINASLGQRYGVPHDGGDAASLALDALVGAQPGRFFCASAGNDGRNKTHWGGFPVEQDSLWIYTWRNDDLYIHVPDEYASTLEFAVEVDSVGNGNGPILKHAGSTEWLAVDALRDSGTVSRPFFYEWSSIQNDTAVVIGMSASQLPTGHTEILVAMDEPRRKFNIYRIKVRGSGMFHSWSSFYIDDPVNSQGGLPFNDRYRPSDSLMQVGVPAVARRVLAVGSYMNRYSYTDTAGVEQPEVEWTRRAPGTLSEFSSCGPTSDGRIKPEIAAPGELVISARVAARKESGNKLVGDGSFMVRSGTSMSTPVVTGAVALYLQHRPTATFDEIHQALTSTAKQDEFTSGWGSLPNNTWGYGKLDIFAALTGPIADVDDGAKAPQVGVAPNPASGFATVRFTLPKREHVSLVVCDILGRVVRTVLTGELGEGEHAAVVDTATLPDGAYLYRLQAGGRVESGTLTVLR